MKKLKISLSMVVMLLVSGGVAWAAFLIDINGDPTQHQFLQGSGNISVTTNSGTHTINWTGHLPVSKGGTGIGSFTVGSVLFASTASISENNSNFFWDNSNKFLGIGTKNPLTSLDVKGTVTAHQVTTNSIVASGSNQSITLSPTGTGKVTAASTIESTSGGFKFPDGTTQTTAATSVTPGGRKFQVDNAGTLTTSLVAYWKMNEGASLSRNDLWDGHNLFQTNYPTQVSGKVGNAASFTSADFQYLNGGNDKAFDNPGAFSIAFWIKTGGQSSGSHKIISKEDESGTGWVIVMAGSGGNVTHKIWLVLHDVNGNDLGKYGSTNLNDDSWHFVVVSRNGQTVTMYVDDVTETIATSNEAGTIGDMSNNAELVVGRGSYTSTQYFDGSLDEVGFWNKVLSSTERSDLYNGGTGQTMVN